ncbi:GtrA family protein [Rhodanobacter sp. MP1X3]|uniref:GtrA family protein n=1 Tax=Rhodanobacter sp. MP1X3 TaxID=2723086 RepID=UPI0018334609|nr:GtrA family protein [Rhodanobacter sp. MP1X3]MBB6241547.1 dolichol-phosphate mannosyltransferase [Rhodanobacter sp. MP1X3]
MIKVIGLLSRLGQRMTLGLLPETLVSFLVVGAMGVVVHITVLKVVITLLTNRFVYANLAAMLFAATFNFFVNNESTFSQTTLVGRRVLLGYVVYMGITGLGLMLSLFISTHLYNRHGMPVPAALAGIIAGAFWNYGMSYTFVWKLLSRTSGRNSSAATVADGD